jgi:hypothetical protein
MRRQASAHSRMMPTASVGTPAPCAAGLDVPPTASPRMIRPASPGNAPQALHSRPPAFPQILALGINNAGQVVGQMRMTRRRPGGWTTSPGFRISTGALCRRSRPWINDRHNYLFLFAMTGFPRLSRVPDIFPAKTGLSTTEDRVSQSSLPNLASSSACSDARAAVGIEKPPDRPSGRLDLYLVSPAARGRDAAP